MICSVNEKNESNLTRCKQSQHFAAGKHGQAIFVTKNEVNGNPRDEKRERERDLTTSNTTK